MDGTAPIMMPLLRFIIRPGALTVRLPRTAPGRSPAARTVRVADKSTVIALWHTVLGRPVVNQPLKLAGERRRPDRTGMGVPESRRVRKTSLATG